MLRKPSQIINLRVESLIMTVPTQRILQYFRGESTRVDVDAVVRDFPLMITRPHSVNIVTLAPQCLDVALN